MNILTKIGFILFFVALVIAGYEIYYNTLTWYCIIPAIFSGAMLNAFPISMKGDEE